MTPFNLYLLITIPKLGGLLLAAGVLTASILAFIMFIHFMCEEDWTPLHNKMIRWIIIPLVAIFVGIAIPSTKQMVAIYAIPALAKNETVLNLGDKGMEVVNAQLDAWIKEIKNVKEDDK